MNQAALVLVMYNYVLRVMGTAQEPISTSCSAFYCHRKFPLTAGNRDSVHGRVSFGCMIEQCLYWLVMGHSFYIKFEAVKTFLISIICPVCSVYCQISASRGVYRFLKVRRSAATALHICAGRLASSVSLLVHRICTCINPS